MDAQLLGWHLTGKAQPLRCHRPEAKQAIKTEPEADPVLAFKAEDPKPASFPGSVGPVDGLPTAPSPAPILESVLPMTFSADGSLLHAAAALNPQLVRAAPFPSTSDLWCLILQ